MNTVKQLVETIKEGIQEKKGQDIVIADLNRNRWKHCQVLHHLPGRKPYSG